MDEEEKWLSSDPPPPEPRDIMGASEHATEDYTRGHTGNSNTPFMAALVTELVGTLFLVYTVEMATNAAPVKAGDVELHLAPFSIGAVLMSMVFSGGFLSGAHYNPAVTFALFVAQKVDGAMLACYWSVQIMGGMVGAALGILTLGGHGTPTVPEPRLNPDGTHQWLSAMVAELMLTLGLTFTVLHAAVHTKQDGNSFYGLAIGFTVLSGAISVGSISGGVFNPAVGLGLLSSGLMFGDKEERGRLWWPAMYIVPQLLGGAFSGLFFYFFHPGQRPGGVEVMEEVKKKSQTKASDLEKSLLAEESL